jgi:hypothetical protein
MDGVVFLYFSSALEKRFRTARRTGDALMQLSNSLSRPLLVFLFCSREALSNGTPELGML